MPIQIPPGYVLIRPQVAQGTTGKRCTNILGAEISAPLTQANVNTLSTSLGSAYKAQMVAGSLYSGLEVLEGQDGPPLLWFSTNGAGAGTRASGAMSPPNVQWIVKKRTALSGHQFRGRAYLFDVKESDVSDDGTVTAGAGSVHQNWADAVDAALKAGVFVTPVLLHSEPEGGGDVPEPTPITAWISETKIATQRRRLLR